MRIRRIRLVLPPRFRATAEHDARMIANALAERLAAGDGTVPRQVTISGAGATGRALATRAAAQLGPAQAGSVQAGPAPKAGR